MCSFFLLFFRYLSNLDRNFAFFDINPRGGGGVRGTPKIFFNIFEQFFAELCRFKNIKRPFCYEISKVQLKFFFKKKYYLSINIP